MINAHIDFEDHFDRLDARIEARVLAALDEGARAMAAKANQQAQGKFHFSVIPGRRTLSGWAAAISADNKKWRIFDKGSLGERHVRLKRDRRKEAWKVSRRGSEYTAHRQHLDTGGVQPLNISNPAKLAGLKALIAALGR